MAAPKKKRAPAKARPRRRIKKSVVTLEPMKPPPPDLQPKIQELEEENRRLKAQLADQRNSSTMLPQPRPVRSYLGLAVLFGITTVLLLAVVLLR